MAYGDHKSKREWDRRNWVRKAEMDANYRLFHADTLKRQAKERMRRYRARHAKQLRSGSPASSRNAGLAASRA